jgi:hypothetical protein
LSFFVLIVLLLQSSICPYPLMPEQSWFLVWPPAILPKFPSETSSQQKHFSGLCDQTYLLKDALGFCVWPWRHFLSRSRSAKPLYTGFIAWIILSEIECLCLYWPWVCVASTLWKGHHDSGPCVQVSHLLKACGSVLPKLLLSCCENYVNCLWLQYHNIFETPKLQMSAFLFFLLISKLKVCAHYFLYVDYTFQFHNVFSLQGLLSTQFETFQITITHQFCVAHKTL